MSPTTVLASQIDALNSLLASRYLTGGALAVLLWDHLTTLDREVQLIWNSRGRSRWMLKGAFAFNRYVNEGFLLFIAYVSSGIQTPSLDLYASVHQELLSYFMFVAFCGTIAAEISQFVFVLRVYALTDQRRSIFYWLTGGFVIAVSFSQVFAVLTMVKLKDEFLFVIPGFNACIAFQKPKYLVAVLAPMCAFDIFIIILTIYNALDRPHRNNAELINNLFKDGAKFFLANTAIHLVDLFTAIFCTPDKILLLLFTFWALGSVLISRLHFKMEKFTNLKYNSLVYPTDSDFE
ncbi:hypothetical protein BDQ17DRAFT_1546046 [Cyathus striatus]|nr:hypothetical protein BDQ17DRAFT_1546046 [Cyathus striatus]